MNQREIHRRALRATAKVALSLTVIGCGARVEFAEDEDDTASSSGTDDASSVSTTGGGAPVVTIATTSGGGEAPVEACVPSPPGELVELDAPSFGCCVAFLGGVGEADWASPTEQHLGCCNEVVGQIDLDPALAENIEPSLVAPVFPATGGTSCCDILGSPCSLPCGCTVWGPPVPWSIAGTALLSLDELEAAERLEAA